jgi:hypothetical protein
MKVLVKTYTREVIVYFFGFQEMFVNFACNPVDAKVDYKVYNNESRYIDYKKLVEDNQSKPQNSAIQENMK